MAYKAQCREDLLAGIDEFLMQVGEVMVLYPIYNNFSYKFYFLFFMTSGVTFNTVTLFSQAFFFYLRNYRSQFYLQASGIHPSELNLQMLCLPRTNVLSLLKQELVVEEKNMILLATEKSNLLKLEG